jgi:thioredoxin-like negative regulator of GroEL
MIRSAEGSGGKRRGRSRRLALVAMMMVCGIMLVTWTDCGCAVERKQVEAEQVETAEAQAEQPPADETAGMSVSEAALHKAKQAGKPVLLNFHSTSCYPCIEIEKQIKAVEPEYAGKVEFIIVDVYDRSEMNLCYEYQIEVIPTTFFIDGKGQVKEGRQGVIQAASLREILDKLIAGG